MTQQSNQLRILFVDDDSGYLRELRRALMPMRDTWDMIFMEHGVKVLQTLAHEKFSVIVCGTRVSGLEGRPLLQDIRQRHPQVLRIGLAQQEESHSVLKQATAAHQYLHKPVDPLLLRNVIRRLTALRNMLADPQLKELIGRIDTLPSLPRLYTELVKELKAPEPSMVRVARIIAQDMGMTSKILQIVNSPFFGVARSVSDPIQAANLLGMDMIIALALTAQAFAQFEDREIPGFSQTDLWAHSAAVATAARRICQHEKCDARVVSNACIAGLLHDVGKLVLAANMPKAYGKVIALAEKLGITMLEAENEIFGATHAEIGGYLLGLWGLPTPVVVAVAFHHRPHEFPSSHFEALTAVHVSNALNLELDAAESTGGENPVQVDLGYLSGLRVLESVGAWRAICEEEALKRTQATA